MIKKNKILTLAFLLILVISISATLASAGLPYTYLPLVYQSLPTIPTTTPTPQPHITGDIVITTIFSNGSGPNEPDEYVEIRNDDTYPIQLASWTLRDPAVHIFTFPNFVIQIAQVCRIYTNESHPEWCGFNYRSGSAIWNNEGDCGYLRDSKSNPIDDYCY